MDMNVFRNFWLNVVSANKPKRPPISIPRRPGVAAVVGAEQPAQTVDQQVAAVALQAAAAERQADAAAYRAALMQRLADLAEPYKEAMANQGPHAKRLQTLFSQIRTNLDKQNFPQAADGLDRLEQWLEVPPETPPVGVGNDDD